MTYPRVAQSLTEPSVSRLPDVCDVFLVGQHHKFRIPNISKFPSSYSPKQQQHRYWNHKGKQVNKDCHNNDHDNNHNNGLQARRFLPAYHDPSTPGHGPRQDGPKPNGARHYEYHTHHTHHSIHPNQQAKDTSRTRSV